MRKVRAIDIPDFEQESGWPVDEHYGRVTGLLTRPKSPPEQLNALMWILTLLSSVDGITIDTRQAGLQAGRTAVIDVQTNQWTMIRLGGVSRGTPARVDGVPVKYSEEIQLTAGHHVVELLPS